MEKNKFFMLIMAAAVAIIIGAAIASPGMAMISKNWISPINNIDGDIIEAGSPYAFSCHRASSETYYKVLMLLESEGDSGIYKKVSVSGYYWLDPSGEYVVYCLWVPYDTPTGHYTLTVSMQGPTWVYDRESDEYKPWGPWDEYCKYDYEIYVFGNEDDMSYGSASLNSNEVSLLDSSSSLTSMVEKADMSSNIQNIDGLDRLNAAQRSILLHTLTEELEQRGEI